MQNFFYPRSHPASFLRLVQLDRGTDKAGTTLHGDTLDTSPGFPGYLSPQVWHMLLWQLSLNITHMIYPSMPKTIYDVLLPSMTAYITVFCDVRSRAEKGTTG